MNFTKQQELLLSYHPVAKYVQFSFTWDYQVFNFVLKPLIYNMGSSLLPSKLHIGWSPYPCPQK